jgi:hypothetical protein
LTTSCLPSRPATSSPLRKRRDASVKPSCLRARAVRLTISLECRTRRVIKSSSNWIIAGLSIQDSCRRIHWSAWLEGDDRREEADAPPDEEEVAVEEEEEEEEEGDASTAIG